MAKQSLPNNKSASKNSSGRLFNENGEKQCFRCKQWKPKTAFGVHRCTPSGLNTYCKLCIVIPKRRPNGYLVSPDRKLEIDRERFFANVNKTETCWLWTGSQTSDGYGRCPSRYLQKRIRAHRFAWFLFHGEVLSADRVVCHSCDTPLCVNPDHLWIGSSAENIKDMWSKGRARPREHKGSDNGRSKLTDIDVVEMRLIHAGGDVTFTALARAYGVSITVARWVVIGKSWKHLPLDISELRHVLRQLKPTGERRGKGAVLTLRLTI